MEPDRDRASHSSPRRQDLLELSYDYVLKHGIARLSLRPLARAVGSSPRVLLFLFGSKDALIREVLMRARADERHMLEDLRTTAAGADLAQAARALWRWLAAEQQRPLMTLWLESYTGSLTDPQGRCAAFASQAVSDWLGVLGAAQSPRRGATPAGLAQRTLVLAVLRGALLDLLASGDHVRINAAVELHLQALQWGATGDASERRQAHERGAR